jgi:hypothetical protein
MHRNPEKKVRKLTIMRFFVFSAGLLLTIACGVVIGQTNTPASAVPLVRSIRSFPFDPATPLDSRIQAPTPEIIEIFERSGQAVPTNHILTEDERRKVSAAFEALPPVHRQILSKHLRAVMFVDGLTASAITTTINRGDPNPLVDIAIRATVLSQTASEWLTEKERTVFSVVNSPLSVSIDAGQGDAITYLFLHEATHAVDFDLHLTPRPTPFTEQVWAEHSVPVPAYRDPLREQARFYAPSPALSINKAQAVYEALSRTPFASLYGARHREDDLAEYVTIYHWTQMLNEPYRIVIRSEGKSVFVYEPMASDLVRSRLSLMKRFYEERQEPGDSTSPACSCFSTLFEKHLSGI